MERLASYVSAIAFAMHIRWYARNNILVSMAGMHNKVKEVEWLRS